MLDFASETPASSTSTEMHSPSQQVLFPSSSCRASLDNWLTVALEEAANRIAIGPVGAEGSYDHYMALLGGFDFSSPRPVESVLSWIIEQMAKGTVHTNHARYFGLFNPTPTYTAQAADRIVARFNPQLATATTSPFPVALEARVIEVFARRVGLPEGSEGHFTTGGSEANATALLCALTAADANYSSHGARAFSGAPVFYVSQDAHLAWLKIAHQTGIGRSAVRLISTNGQGQMDAEKLSSAIRADLSCGCVPLMIASTAGTTNAGVIDPLLQCNDVAKNFGIWHHVDAAWGGALICSTQHRARLIGLDAADSITIDAHKWLATTMGCGMFMVRRKNVLAQTFRAAMDCMPSNDAKRDPYVTTLQWSRRFIGLRLFVGLAAAGWSGYAAHIDNSVELANSLEARLVAGGWIRHNQLGVGVLCMQPPGKTHPRTIAKAVVENGLAWVSAAEFEGRSVVRFCLTSGETTGKDIKLLCDLLDVILQRHVTSSRGC